MKSRKIRAWRFTGVLLAATALLYWSGQNGQGQSVDTIHEAAGKGDLEGVKRHLALGADINAKDSIDRTPLHIASEAGRIEIVKLMLAKGADIKANDSFGNTPLHLAAGRGQTNMVELLTANGADVNATTKQGVTPLLEAAGSGEKDLVELLIAKGANVDAATSEGITPLCMAANAMIAELLIAKGANINGQTATGLTPLHTAAGSGHADVAELLIGKGANVGARITKVGLTPLHIAAIEGQKKVAELLVDHGANVDVQAGDGVRPLHAAALNGHAEFIAWLITKGADVNARGKTGLTPLHCAASECYRDAAEVLIAHGADLNAKTDAGQTPLQLAEKCDPKLIDLLKGQKAGVVNEGQAQPAMAPDPSVNVRDQNDGSTPLHRAVRDGDIERVKILLAKGADIEARDKYGYTPLRYAVNYGKLEMAELLIAKGADINTKDNDGYTPLQLANNPDPKLIILFKKQRAGVVNEGQVQPAIIPDPTVNVRDEYQGFTPLHSAVRDEDIEKVKILLAKGADMNAKDNYAHTPLGDAIDRGHREIAKLLIARGAGLNEKGRYGYTFLGPAVEKGQKEILESLIAKGADLDDGDKYGNSPLRLAIDKGLKEIAELLMASGADINKKDGNGYTPLDRAIDKGQKEIVELLIASGVDINAKDQFGYTPLHQAVEKNQKEIAALLIARGMDVNAKDKFGETLLHEAASLGNKNVAELLIARGADVNAKKKNGETPLYSAALTGSKETAELLIARGADVDARDEGGMTPLARCAMQATGTKHNETAELLVAEGADVNAADKNGWTPLHFAVLGCHLEMARLLISLGADIDVKDNEGKTPLQRVPTSIYSNPKELAEMLMAAQERKQKPNAVLAEATRKVIHRPSKSASKRLAEINTLKYAFIDPNTGRVSFIGTYDPAYASGPIPYADLLAEALEHPYPSFSLDEGPSKPAVQTINRLFDKELGRVSTDPEYGVQWMQNILGTILRSKSTIPERLVLEQRLKKLGIEPRGFTAYLDLKNSNADFTSEEQYQLVRDFMGKFFASIGIEERFGNALMLMSMIQQMVRRGEGERVTADGKYWELIDLLGISEEVRRMQNVKNTSAQQLWVLFYSSLLKGLGMPARQVDNMVNRVEINTNRFDAELAPAADALQKSLAKEALLRNILNSFVLSQAFLKRLYSLPTIYSGVRLYGQRADSPLTRVMFDADYALKYVTTLNPDTASLPGYLSTVEFLSAEAERLGRSNELKNGYVREWIRPGELTLEPFTDNSGVRFVSATLRISVEPLDDASKKKSWLRPVLSEYASRLSERYDDYARLFPSLHVMRETEKIIALARWIKQNSLQVDVPKARPVSNPVPDRVEGLIDLTYVRKATGGTDDVFVCADGGVVFDQNEGDGWIKTQPSVTTTDDVLKQLVVSVALAEKGAAAALDGDMEGARDLAQLSADAMIGHIDTSRLTEPVAVARLAPNESVAGRVEVAQAAIAATELNAAALAKARASLQQAEPLKTSDPARYAQIHQESQATIGRSEQNLRHLGNALAKYRLKPADSPTLATEVRDLDPDKPVEDARPQQPADAADWTAEQCQVAQRRVAACREALRQTVEVADRFNRTIAEDQKQRQEWVDSMTAAVERAKSRGLFLWLALPLAELNRLNGLAAKGLERDAADTANLLSSTADEGRRTNLRIIRQYIAQEKDVVARLGNAYQNIDDAQSLSQRALLIDDDPEESPTSPFKGDGMKMREAMDMLFNLLKERDVWKRLASSQPWLKYATSSLATAFKALPAAEAMFDSWYDAFDVWLAWKQLNSLNLNPDRFLQAVQKLGVEMRQRNDRLKAAEREFAAECSKRK